MFGIKFHNSSPKVDTAGVFVATHSSGVQDVVAVLSDFSVIVLAENLSEIISVYDNGDGLLGICSGYGPVKTIRLVNLSVFASPQIVFTTTLPAVPPAGTGYTSRMDYFFKAAGKSYGLFRSDAEGNTSSNALFGLSDGTHNTIGLSNFSPSLYELTGGAWVLRPSTYSGRFPVGTSTFHGAIFPNKLRVGVSRFATEPFFAYTYIGYSGAETSTRLVYGSIGEYKLYELFNFANSPLFSSIGAAIKDDGTFGFAFNDYTTEKSVLYLNNDTVDPFRDNDNTALENHLSHVWGNGSVYAYDGAQYLSSKGTQQDGLYTNVSPNTIFNTLTKFDEAVYGNMKFTGLTLST